MLNYSEKPKLVRTLWRNRKHPNSSSFSSKVFPFIRMGCVSSKFLKKHLYVNDDYDGGGNSRANLTHKSTLDVKEENSFVSVGFQRHYVSLTSTSYGLLRIESPTKHVEKKIKKDFIEETLTEMYGKLNTLEMNLTQSKPSDEEMNTMISPDKLTSSPLSCRKEVRLSIGSANYAISETIDVDDMMMGLEEAATQSECSSSPLPHACKRLLVHSLHRNPKKLGKKARYSEDLLVSTCETNDGDDEVITESKVLARDVKDETYDYDYSEQESTTNEFSKSESKLSSSRQPNHGPKQHNPKIMKKPNILKKSVSEVIDAEGFGDENAMPQQVQNTIKVTPSKNKPHTRSPLGSVPLKRRESIAIANNRILGSLDVLSMKSSPKRLSPMTKNHTTMMMKYSTPSPKGTIVSPLSRSGSGSSTRAVMDPTLLLVEPNKSSRRVFTGTSLLYSPPNSPLFDPELVASYEEALENISWDENHKENELRMQEVEKELSEALCIYAPSNGLDRDNYDRFVGFEEKCPPGGTNRIVLYTTTLRGIRKTFEDCNNVRSILHGFDLIIDERDVSMHLGFLNELKELMGRVVSVPRMFVKGRYIGGVEEIRKLHEEGLLNELVEGFPRDVNKELCDGCGGVRFVPCLECNGSCKVRKGEEISYSRCLQCNENGLIRCPICI